MAQDTDWEKGSLAGPAASSINWETGALSEPPKRTWGQAIKDTGAQLAEGVNTALGAVPDLIAPDSGASQFFRGNAEHWREAQSDPLKQRMAATGQRIQEAGKEGVLSQVGTAVSEYWNDPAQAARLVATNLPSMVPGLAAGKAAQVASAARGASAAQQAAAATGVASAANAAMNAGGARGEAFDDLQKAHLAQGAAPDQAREAALSESLLPAAVGGVAGAVSGKVGLERAVLGQAGAGSVARKAAGAAGAELAGEQIEEVAPQVATNFQVGRVDGTRGLADDVGRTMVETAIGAGPGAVVAGGVEGMRTADASRAAVPALDPGAAQVAEPEWGTAPGAAAPRPAAAAAESAPVASALEPDFQTMPGAAPDYGPGLDFRRDIDTSGLALADDAATPSQRMGIDPTAGPLSAGAALAVDSGASDQLQQASVLAEAADVVAKAPDRQKEERKPQAPQGADPETGEIPGPDNITSWSDTDLSTAFRGAQSREVRLRLAQELQRRRGAREQQELQAELDAEQAGTVPGADGADTAFASVSEDAGTAPAALAPTTEGTTNGRTSAANARAQAAPAPGAQVAEESREQRAQRIDSAGQTWGRLPALQRQVVAEQLKGVKPILQKNLSGAKWENLNSDLKRKIADLIVPAALANQSPAAINDVAVQPPRATKKGAAKAARTDVSASDAAGAPNLEARAATESGVDPLAARALTDAAHEAATSSSNDLAAPTPAQIEAGNYKKGHARVAGLDISIENPAGSRRRPEWPPLQNHYGYIKGTKGADKDHVDVFMTDRADDASLPVFVVDQVNRDGSFDEHKVVMGAADEAEARSTYLGNYQTGWTGLGAVTQMTQDEFKAWVRDPAKTAKPAAVPADQTPVKNAKPAVARPEAEPSATTAAPAKNEAPAPETVAQRMKRAKAEQALAAAPAPAKPKAQSKGVLSKLKESQAARADYFTPGNIVKSYGGHDRVVSYAPPDENGRWSVTVRAVRKEGDGWVDLPREQERVHATQPDARELKAGPVQRAEAPPAPAATPEPDVAAASKITDFGEKIGGARKDQATKAPKAAKPRSSDERPAWARRFEISQIAKSSRVGEEGRWVVRDARSLDALKQPRRVGAETYATREEAEQAVPLLAVAQKHRPVPLRGDGAGYEIWRDVSDRKRVKVVDQVFPTREAALEYMAKNAQAIIETNTTFGEADLPRPPSEERVGEPRRTGDARDSDFMEVFGFRGVEFGNWNNQQERQQLLNEAYDGLLDLADVMGVPPRAISLDGDLALAFGARGHGLSSARAHYEPAKAVINLTKMNGAGSLAHEWFHALDHYFGRQDGKAPAEWVVDKDGTRSLNIHDAAENNMVSGGTRGERSGMRPELREAFAEVMRTIARKAEGYVEDTARADRFVASAREDVKRRLDSMRADLARELDPKYYKRFNKAATADQLAEFDSVAEKIVSGELLEVRLESNESARSIASGIRWTNDALNRLSAVMKAVRGRQGFAADKDGPLDRLRGLMQNYSARLKMLADAQGATEKTRAVPTEFVMNAKELDQGRGQDYWTRPHELAARAFQGYVEDKIAARGGRSPFLNYGPEGAVIPTPWGFKRPFPAGAERVAINKALDGLAATIKARESEAGGVALFRRGADDDLGAGMARELLRIMGKGVGFSPEAQRQAVESVRATVNPIIAAWRNAPEVVVAYDLNDPIIPQRVRDADLRQRSGGAHGAPEGFYYGGKAYLMASRLTTPEKAARVLFHEVAGHHGLRGLYGPELDKILNQVTTMRRADVDAKMAEYGMRGVDRLSRQQAAEEILAEMAEKNPRLSFVRRAVAAIRNFLRSHVPGFESLRLSDADIIQAYILPARGWVERSKEESRRPAATAGLQSPGVAGSASGSLLYSMGDASDVVLGRQRFAALKESAMAQITQTLSHPGKVSIWDKTIGTMRHLGERKPAFKPVFDSAQRFIDDVSMLGNDAADQAPRLLPRVDSWKDLRKKPISAADNKAVAKPLFEGTLLWARDIDGTPVQVDDLAAKYKSLPADEKAQLMLRGERLDPGVLQMWRGLPLAQYEAAVNTSFDSRVLKAGVVWSDDELQSMFNLDANQVSLYREGRAAIDRSIDMTARADMLRGLGEEYAGMRDAVLAQDSLDDAVELLTRTLMDDARDRPDMADRLTTLNNGVVKAQEKAQQLMDEGYAPLSRFGRYTVDVVDAAGERQYFGMFETKADSNRMKAEMEKQFPGATVTQGTMSQDAFKLFAGVTPESLEMFGSMLGLDGKGDEPKDKAFQAYLQLAKNNHSALKRLIHRKGIAGYSEDVGRVLASFVYSNARLGAGGLNAGTMENAINAIPKEEGELKDLALGLRDYIANPQEEGQAVRGMLFAQYLGGSLASAFVNMTQPFAVTLPWLTQFGGARKAGAQMAKALNDMRRSWTDKGFKYEADLAAALQSAEDDGVVSPQEIHQLMAQARGTGSLRTGDGTKAGDARAAAANNWERVKVAWGQPFALAEQFNRRSTFIAAYRIAKEQGMAEPSSFARKAVLETQFLYSKANKMRFARGAVGGTLMTFKTYSVSYLELMHRMWTQGGPEGKKAVGWAIAMLLLMSGAGGLPFMEDAEDLIDGAGQLMGYNLSAKQWRKQLLQDVVGKEFAEFMEQGISGLPGAPVDVSGRLGMGNLIPGTGLFLSKQNRERDLLEVAGPAGDLVARGFTAGRKVLTGDVGGAALELSPTAVRNWAKGIDMGASGIYKDTKGYKVIDTTLDEAIAKFAGFQPKSVAEVQEANSFMQRTKSFYTQTSSEIKAQWADALFRKDEADLERVRDRLADWNANNPDQPIVVRMPDVWKRVREMGKDRTQRIAETAPKALREQMREISREQRGGTV